MNIVSNSRKGEEANGAEASSHPLVNGSFLVIGALALGAAQEAGPMLVSPAGTPGTMRVPLEVLIRIIRVLCILGGIIILLTLLYEH